jgi:hypothetical protein
MPKPCVIYEFGELQKPTSTISPSGKLEDLPLSVDSRTRKVFSNLKVIRTILKTRLRATFRE